jgi:hypothetical protein
MITQHKGKNRAHLRLRRNVDQGRTLTRCPIIDILCNVGWRLNTIKSSSLKWRSTWKWEAYFIKSCNTTVTSHLIAYNENLNTRQTIASRFVYTACRTYQPRHIVPLADKTKVCTVQHGLQYTGRNFCLSFHSFENSKTWFIQNL